MLGHRPWRVGFWLGLGHVYAGVCPLILLMDGLLLVFCLNAPSQLRILVCFYVLPCKTYKYQNT
jgi:hypothetical protein